MNTDDTSASGVVPVVIVGGGPVGLAASLLLSDLGVDSLLVERNATTSDHPKAHVVNTRTMEVFRGLGVAEAVRDQAIAPEMMAHVRWVRTFAGEELASLLRRGGAVPPSPEPGTSCAQDRVEEALVAASAHRRGRLRFGTEVSSVEPDDEGVTVRFADGGTQRARYVIAADGAASAVRDQLGIAMEGEPELGTMLGTYFHADLSRWTDERPGLLYWVMNGRAPGTFIGMDGVERWVFHQPMPPDSPRIGDDEAADIVRAAIGDPSVEIDVQSVRGWRMTAQVAARYQQGRVFLAGDAAHRFPPTGGLGLNSGVQDVHNLAWKLARVLAGSSPESLLDTYEQERRPIAQRNCEFSVHNARSGGTAFGPGAAEAIAKLDAGGPGAAEVVAELRGDVAANSAHFGGLGMDLGFRYDLGALIPEADIDETSADPDTYVPSGRPGGRAPHIVVDGDGDGDGEPRSVLDHFGTEFVLLVAWPADKWAADNAVEIPAGEPYGLEPGGAVLVRPDGHIAWRAITPPDSPADALIAARRAIYCP